VPHLKEYKEKKENRLTPIKDNEAAAEAEEFLFCFKEFLPLSAILSQRDYNRSFSKLHSQVL